MTEYVYTLTTNTPVGAFRGPGGSPDIHHSDMGGNITAVGDRGRAHSTAVSAPDGHTFDLVLVEIRDDVAHEADALIHELGLNITPWQRSILIRSLQAHRRGTR